MLEGDTLDEVKDFRYLGSIVDTHGETETDVKKRISKARVAFHLLRNVWKSKVIGETTKIRLFNINVKSVLLYGAETWRIKDHADKDPDICQPLPEKIFPNTLDGQGEQQRPLG